MKKWLSGLAVLPLLSGTALAQPLIYPSTLAQQPLVLSEKQMDGVTAGWDLQEVEDSNTSTTWVFVYTPNSFTCDSCYLNLTSPAISVFSLMKGSPTGP
jgi:hypothetical protein